jgi:hypothetical protein
MRARRGRRRSDCSEGVAALALAIYGHLAKFAKIVKEAHIPAQD